MFANEPPSMELPGLTRDHETVKRRLSCMDADNFPDHRDDSRVGPESR